jgi:uncharacterized protein (PEP-CTERM system associated)
VNGCARRPAPAADPRQGAAAVLALALCALAAAAHAQETQGWRVRPYLTLRETLTNNVNLQPPGREESDFITEVTPGVRIDGRGPRVEAEGTIAARTLWYARTGDRNNIVYPQANLRGRVEALRDFFFVEAQATVVQTYLSPFGSTSLDESNASRNRYTAEYYRLSPFFEGELAGGRLHYVLRNDSAWTSSSGAAVAVASTYSNTLSGLIESGVEPLGWALDARRQEITFANQDDSFLDELGRATLRYQATPDWRVSGNVGYERRVYPLDEASGVIYGGGVEWRPGQRTALVARFEERVFGPSYFLSFDHRRAWSSLRVLATRNITSYPQLIGTFGADGLDSLVGAAFITRFPDPVAREAAVQEFLQRNALPTNLAGATPFYTQQVLLQETQQATYTLIGKRNAVAFNVFHQRNRPVAGATGVELPPELSFSNDNDQTGGSVTWSHRATALDTVNVLGSYTDVETFLTNNRTDNAKLYLLRLLYNRSVGAKTSAFSGIRFQRRDANFSSDYREAAVFVGVTHYF